MCYFFFVLSLNSFVVLFFFFFSSRRRHTRLTCDWSSDVCSSDLGWFLASLTFFAIFFLATRRRTRSSNYAIVFYYLFGLDNVIGDLASGSPWLALASFIIFTIATLIIFLVNGDRWRKLLGINAPTKSVS